MKTLFFAMVSFLALSASAIEKNRVTLEFDVNSIDSRSVATIFVIDNSGSMGKYQSKVMTWSDTYFRKISTMTGNYRFALLSTDLNDATYGQVDQNTTDPVASFNQMVGSLGTNGSATELVLKSLDQFISAREGQKFIRNISLLNVVIVSDEEEQSGFVTMDYVNRLSAQVPGQLVFNSLVNNESCDQWNGGPDKGVIYEELAKLTAGGVFSICEEDYSSIFENITNSMQTRLGQRQDNGKRILPFQSLELGYFPIIETLKVSFGSQVIPFGFLYKGWTYDSINNAIIFGRDLELDQNQPEDTKLTIKFDI